MLLESFEVLNFRSINKSGEIKTSQITSLLGRNESGKSNLLLGLRSLNPVEGFEALHKIKDFPRHRRLDECTNDTPLVATRWKLTDEEQQALAIIRPRADSVTHVEVRRPYAARYSVKFVDLAPIQLDAADVRAKIRKISPAVRAAAEGLEDLDDRTVLKTAADDFEKAMGPAVSAFAWATAAKEALPAIRQAYAAAGVEVPEKLDRLIVELEEISDFIVSDEAQKSKAEEWVLGRLPIFIYLDEYPELNGHENIAEYLNRKTTNQLKGSDRSFEKLCKVAGLDPDRLQSLLHQKDAETRNQLVNRASAVVTKEIRRLWNDRALKIRFNVDAEHLDTFVSDSNANYDVEVSLDERSRGFRWFFSFYITFSADTQSGTATNAILLLDEPGLYLHTSSQADLLSHLENDYPNQIIYTTHSPFMMPIHNLDAIRTVNIADQAGTTVTNDPTGDARTLFPLQTALGYNLSQSLFVRPNNLVVDAVTDFWILRATSDYLIDAGMTGLSEDLTVTPVGGAQKVSYLVALLTSEKLNVLLLLDDDKGARARKDELVHSKLIRDKNVVFISEAAAHDVEEADIEDLLDPVIYEGLVRNAYRKELAGKTMTLNPEIPRIAKRLEAALRDLGIQFHKTRPARLFLQRMAADPKSVITPDTAARFEALFSTINQRLTKQGHDPDGSAF